VCARRQIILSGLLTFHSSYVVCRLFHAELKRLEEEIRAEEEILSELARPAEEMFTEVLQRKSSSHGHMHYCR
jgi:hypothetical protein